MGKRNKIAAEWMEMGAIKGILIPLGEKKRYLSGRELNWLMRERNRRVWFEVLEMEILLRSGWLFID